MKKLANKFCFGALAVIAATLLTTGCSKQPQPQPQPWQAPNAQVQVQPGVPGAPSAPGGAAQAAIPQGEISLARNFYFVFDGSGSMRGARLRDAKAAVREFMNNVPNDVNLGLYVFDYYGEREVLPLGGNNRTKFLAEIDKVSADNGTPLGASVRTGARALAAQRDKQLQYGEFRLIVITDGESSDSIEYGTDEAERLLVPIYTIGFQIGERHALRQKSVSYKSANDLQELRKALEDAAAELDVFDPQSFKK
ncbi:MAG: VWA domain-containing protein [Candidatus Melainabacteria bacterium]|nr:VWA domain-containing protein [Candidatus Melainabacteria bacterium]